MVLLISLVALSVVTDNTDNLYNTASLLKMLAGTEEEIR
jgi:hypothetical protein